MTFSEGMQIDTSTTSTGGGGVGRGIAIGGGVGGPGDRHARPVPRCRSRPGDQPAAHQAQTQSGPGVDLSKCKTGADANKYVDCRVVATGNSVDGVWNSCCAGTAGRR